MKRLPVIQDDLPWYAEGLRFECTGCGRCCTGSPGYIWVDENEIAQIAASLNITVEAFGALYLRKVKGQYSLRELPITYDCIFLKDKKCQIYAVRPTQCRTFPWWPRLLKSAEEWQEAAKTCEGICSSAPIVLLDTIEQQRLLQEQAFMLD